MVMTGGWFMIWHCYTNITRNSVHFIAQRCIRSPVLLIGIFYFFFSGCDMLLFPEATCGDSQNFPMDFTSDFTTRSGNELLLIRGQSRRFCHRTSWQMPQLISWCCSFWCYWIFQKKVSWRSYHTCCWLMLMRPYRLLLSYINTEYGIWKSVRRKNSSFLLCFVCIDQSWEHIS